MMGWQSIRIAGVSACVILLQKIQKMAKKDMTFGYHLLGTPTSLRKQKMGKCSRNIAQPCSMVHGCVNDDLGLMDCRKPGDFGSVTRMLTH